ncbi:hypothetical protein D1007_08766 [Hordeum vulgare]|nr:hypothetical protein D1007_08766 [Hordeum vulgare]
MKKSGASQQQYEAISEVKVASNGIDETELLDNMPPRSVSPGLASKQTGKQASCTQVLANESKQEASPTVFQASTAEATLNATKVVPIQVKKGGSTVSVSKAKPAGTQPLDAKHEAKSILEVVQESSKENLFHFSDVEDRFQKFMPLSGKTTNALEINVLDVSELLASPMVIEYGGYFVILRELTKSMKKEGFVLSHVMEVGLESIMLNLPPDSKKVVMPLRFSIMFPVLENIEKTEPVTRNHYWIFNVNIRDQRFEVLDFWRMLKNKSLNVCARKIVASVRVMWEEHYARSHISLDDFGLINIEVPQQDNEQASNQTYTASLDFVK